MNDLRSSRKRAKAIKFHSMQTPQSELKLTKIPTNQKNPKDSNEPCNLGPKREKAKFE